MFSPPKIRFAKQKQIIIWLHEKVYKKASYFTSNSDCPIATAVKQQVSRLKSVYVNTFSVEINGTKYSIVGTDMEDCLRHHSCGGYHFVEWANENNMNVPIVLERIDS